MTDQELRDLVAENSKAIRELRKSQKETDKQIKQTNKQIGELGRKFGAYTEGLAEQSLKKIFRDKFKLEFSAKNVRHSRNGNSIELDMLGYSNSKTQTVFVAEIKSSFSEEDLEQVLKTLQDFPRVFPEHDDKKLYGVIAAVNIPKNMRNRVIKNGIYLMVLGDEVFHLEIPKNFAPKQFNPNLSDN